jgi:hypothetical protein
MTVQSVNIVRAFLQGFTGAGLFRRLNYPGAPAHFVDPRSLAQLIAAGEVDRNCWIFAEHRYGAARDEARQQNREAEAAKVADREAEAAKVTSVSTIR